MFREERKSYFPPVGTRSCISHGPRTHANAGGSRLNSPPWCSKCNRKHDERLCPGMLKHCLHCKETGHIKRYCPMSRQSMNAIETGRPQSIGKVVKMCGSDASEADGLTRCGMYEEKVNESQRSYALTGYRDRNFQGSRPPTFPTGEVFTPWCNKCGRLHQGSTCSRSDNKCFYCKELGHIKRYCPKLSRRMIVVHAERARDHGRRVAPSGVVISGVDDSARGKSHGDRYSLFSVVDSGATHSLISESGCGKWCDIYRRFSLLVVIPNLYYSVDMRDDVPVGFNPGNGLASWKPRLIERFSPERERITWEGEILDYTGGFSPERELSRPARNGNFGLLTL
ncbi:hypothetical protein Lal_00015610 [Lupinus albus]|nr:hypothetical protein Lal_00015610 [Lupinus albus]